MRPATTSTPSRARVTFREIDAPDARYYAADVEYDDKALTVHDRHSGRIVGVYPLDGLPERVSITGTDVLVASTAGAALTIRADSQCTCTNPPTAKHMKATA